MRAVLLVLTVTFASAADNNAWDRAWALYSKTDYPNAIAALRQAPQDGRTLELLGRAYFMNGDFRSATNTLEKAASLSPNSSSTQMWLGRAYGRRAETSFPIAALGYAGKTREAFEKAVELNPANSEAVNDLFEFYVEAPGIVGGGIDKARKLLPAIAKNDPAEAHFASARLAEEKKDYHAAEVHLRRAVEAAPREAGRLLDLAKFLARRARYDESEKCFIQAEKLDPASPEVLFARATAYVEAKRNLDQARDLLKKYLATGLTPENPPRSEAMKLLKRAEGG